MTPSSPTPPERKKSSLPFLAGLLAIALVVPLGWFLFFLRDAPPPPPPPPPPVAKPVVDAGPKQTQVRLAEVHGTVQVRRGGTGEWVDLKEGDVLGTSDGVRTADGSYAVMVGGEFWEVKMEPGTEVAIGELSESISQLLLANGMAKAKVKGAGRHTFEVKSTTGDALARTDGGVFTIASNGQGTVAVGAEEGEVAFVGKGRVVIVKAGQESIIRPGQAPSEPTAIPSSLLLKVSLPAHTSVNTPKLVLKGEVRPGSIVEVQGHSAVADEKGRFTVTVKLNEGQNSVEVKAKGVSGLEQASAHKVELDTTVKPPSIDKDLWK